MSECIVVAVGVLAERPDLNYLDARNNGILPRKQVLWLRAISFCIARCC